MSPIGQARTRGIQQHLFRHQPRSATRCCNMRPQFASRTALKKADPISAAMQDRLGSNLGTRLTSQTPQTILLLVSTTGAIPFSLALIDPILPFSRLICFRTPKMTGTESTQAFSEGHVEQRLAELAESKHSENRRESHAHAADLIPGISQLRLQGLDTPLIKSTRIVLQDRHGANDIKAWSLLPRGRKGPQTKLEPVHIDSAELLVLPQTASDVGHHIRVECPGPSNRDLGLPLQIVYDASSEGVLVKNDSDVDIWIAPLPASDSVPPIRMVRGQSRSLSPGPWSLSTSPSESPLICFRVLPRAFCDIDRQPSSLGATSLPPAPGSKRGAPESSEATDIGDVPLQKKRAESAVAVQGNDADLELTNALIIEAPPAPPPPRLPPQPAAATPPANSVALRNPFLGLERGSIAHLAGPNESDCYTLVRGEDIAESVHAMVFKAIHSPRQKTESGGKLVVVKVLKKGHSGIARVAELWLAETAINTKLAGNVKPTLGPLVQRHAAGDT